MKAAGLPPVFSDKFSDFFEQSACCGFLRCDRDVKRLF